MKLKYFTAIILVGALGFSIPALGQVFSSASGEQQVRVCVNNKTQNVKYFSKRTKCPAKFTELILNKQGLPGAQGPQGSQGASGRSGSEFLRNCFQKREAAIAAGAILASKQDRAFFERQTGCVVEEIKDQQFIEIVQASGVPVITHWELLEVDIVRAGGGIYNFDQGGGGTATYSITIANYDAISPLGGQFTFCLPLTYLTVQNFSSRNFTTLTQISEDSFQGQTFVNTRPIELVAPMTLGIKDGIYCNVIHQSKVPFQIHVDPESVTPDYLWPGWGW